jgi:pimeloyl-ACP methyl ester carboxylesterase
LGLGSNLWRHFLGYFRKDYPTLTWDYRAHGRSEIPKNSKNLKIRDHCQDLETLCRHLNIQDRVLIGHSMGVQILFETYGRFNSPNIRGLVAICGSYEDPLETVFHTPFINLIFPYLHQWVGKNGLLFKPLWKFLTGNRIFEEILKTIATNRTMIQQGDWQDYMGNIRKIDLQSYFQVLKGARDHSAREVLKRVKIPTLVIAGQWDHITPLKVMKTLARRIGKAELLVVPHGSHCTLLDQPELLNLKTEEFLQNLEPINPQANRFPDRPLSNPIPKPLPSASIAGEELTGKIISE